MARSPTTPQATIRTPELTGSGGIRPAVAIVATGLICLPILGVALAISHIRVDEFDAWLFAYFGKQLAQGRVLYSQLWDNKPPGIFWVNAIGLRAAGGSLIGPAVLCGAAVAGACAVFFTATRRLYGLSTACVATVMAALFLNQQFFHVGCNRPNTYFVLTELSAFLFYVRALTSSGSAWRCFMLAGAVACLGVWFKQSALALAVSVGAHQVVLSIAGVQSFGTTARRIGLFACGWLAAAALALAILATTSDLGWAWHAIVSFNRLYFAAKDGSRWWPHWFGVQEQVRVLALPAILALATLLHAAASRLGRLSQKTAKCDPDLKLPPMLLALLWVWMLSATYLALVGPHQRLPYFAIALPPLCVLSAHGVFLFLATGRSAGSDYPPYHLFVGLAWFAYMMIAPLENQLRTLSVQHYHRFDEREPDPDIATAEIARRHSSPQETLFVWGYAPEIYWRADRPPAIRYIGTEKAGQLGPVGQSTLDEIVQALRNNPPQVLVIGANTLLKMNEPSGKDPLKYGDLADWIEMNYTLSPDAPRQDVWVKNIRGRGSPQAGP